MDKKLLKKITHICRRRRKTAGFTLIELLVSVAIGWIVISGLIYMVVQMMQTDRKEFALTQTSSEMDVALNYIATDLQDAVYVYEGACIPGRGAAGATEFCPGIAKSSTINFPATVNPVLAFWKLEDISENRTGTLPTNCATATNPNRCNALKLSRQNYSLVVYSLRTDNPSGETWQGPARLTRYQLREYSPAPASLSNLTQTTNWVDPFAVNFIKWPCDNAGSNCQAQAAYSEGGNTKNADVLVDLVDTGNIVSAACPNNFSTPYIANNNTSFYACVSTPNQSQGQDVIVHLRGNAIERAGLTGSNPSFLPQVKAQARTRVLFNTKPLDIPQ